MKTREIKKTCIHCGKGRATIEVHTKVGTFYVHKSCAPIVNALRLVVGTNGRMS